MYLKILILTLYLTFNLGRGQFSDNIDAELNLTSQLFLGYSKTVRPTDYVVVNVSIYNFQLIGLDEKNQIMTSMCVFLQTWYDPQLSWNPSAYNNITYINVPADLVWKPQTLVLNAASGDGFLAINKESSYANIRNGNVFLHTPLLTLQTRCPLDVREFPFDTQTCNITILTMPPPLQNIWYTIYTADTFADSRAISQNGIWDIGTFNYTNSPYIYGDYRYGRGVSIMFSLSRRGLYYIMNTILPCVILDTIVFLAFFIPFANQIAICE